MTLLATRTDDQNEVAEEELYSDDECGEDEDAELQRPPRHRDTDIQDIEDDDDNETSESEDSIEGLDTSEAVVVEEADTDDEEDILTATAIVDPNHLGINSVDHGDETPKKRRRSTPKRKRFDRDEAAAEARAMLHNTLSRLPSVVGEGSHVIRSMGKIRTDDTRYSNRHHIYPVGFSCDRYEFSPVHGRILKLRCTILDGATVRAKQKQMGLEVTVSEGPLFRIMWGPGIDDETDSPSEYSYDMDRYSEAITKASYLAFNQRALIPMEGLRVRVKYEGDQYYAGTIISVEDNGDGSTEISVQYDDGSTEQAKYPDPDITLIPPGGYFYVLQYSMHDHTQTFFQAPMMNIWRMEK
jgi:F/Y-rich N-terminus